LIKMGLLASKYQKGRDAYGNIFVQLDKTSYLPEEVVTGVIHIDLKADFPGNTLNLRFRGKEKNKWYEGSGKTRRSYDVKDTFLNSVLTVHKFPLDCIPRGQYSCPFAFKLPPNLPGSFFHSGLEERAEIKYSIYAFLQPTKPKDLMLIFKGPVTIREHLKMIEHDKNLEKFVGVSECCGCYKEPGKIFMRAYFEKNAYLPGEEANIICEIDNSQNYIDVKRVEFKFKRSLTLRNKYGATHTFNANLINLRTAGIPAGSVAIGDNCRKATIKLPPCRDPDFSNLSDQVQAQIKPDDNIKNPITPSTNGKYITAQYFLDVKCVMDTCNCCNKPTRITIPVQIYAPAVTQYYQVQAPQNWAPEVFPSVNLALNGANFYVPPNLNDNNGMMNNYMPNENAYVGYNDPQGHVLNFTKGDEQLAQEIQHENNNNYYGEPNYFNQNVEKIHKYDV